MSTTLPCLDSTIAPRAILTVIEKEFSFESGGSCELVQHHLDATYLLEKRETKAVARLYNARWWSRDEIESEVDVVLALVKQGVPVASPIQRRAGGHIVTVEAPEGPRHLVLSEYLDGQTLLIGSGAQQMGKLAARFHQALKDHTLLHPRPQLTLEGLFELSFDVALRQLDEGNPQRLYLEDLRARAWQMALELDVASLRHGICHGDLNFSNFITGRDGQVWLFDFETCGYGILAYDLAVFRWCQRNVGAPDSVWKDFLQGYRSELELPERELQAMDLLILLRQAFMLGHAARRTEIESLGTRWRRGRRSQPTDQLRAQDARLFGTESRLSW